VGGVLYGLVLGYGAFLLLRSVDDYAVEILVTLAVVTGGYALAIRLHTSGPLAMVVAGLLIGNRGRALAMSDRTRESLDTFWMVVDETLNAMLFVLIGLEMLALELRWESLLAGLVAIPLVLVGRLASVSLPIWVMRFRASVKPYTVRLLTWGGLRGGIAIALALSIPAGGERDLILAVTYVVVVFSILVQGLTVEPLARRRVARLAAADAWDAPEEADVRPGG
jgi:CPA1 family monovalent cation:H+ antiporter